MSERKYKIAMFGATGFTGGLSVEYLATHAPPGLSWAVAGRTEHKLRAIVDRLSGAPCPPSGVLVASVGDRASLRAMAAATDVVMSTVGPFERYGEPVVGACVRERTDYVDITGEPQFVDRTVARFHTEARDKQLKIVSCCGFDSIPHDLGVLYTLGYLPHDRPITIKGFVRSRGTFSGGTWHSAVEAMGKMRQYAAERKRRSREPATGGRKVRGVASRVYYERALGAWAAPLPTIDPQIVLRSAKLCDEYGPDFRYGHFARVKRLTTVVGGGVVIGAIAALAQLPPTRALLLKVKARGDGPSREERDRAWFEVTFLAEAGDVRVTTQVKGGDPGYTETAKMLSESALCLALDRGATPKRYGVITTAAAMGTTLIERLERAGITFRRLA